jgi:hypothetical protein
VNGTAAIVLLATLAFAWLRIAEALELEGVEPLPEGRRRRDGRAQDARAAS